MPGRTHSKEERTDVNRRRVWLLLPAMGVALAAPSAASAAGWALKYSEDFNQSVNTDASPWVKYNYDRPVDNIMDDNGDWWKNDYGEAAYTAALNSYNVFR